MITLVCPLGVVPHNDALQGSERLPPNTGSESHRHMWASRSGRVGDALAVFVRRSTDCLGNPPLASLFPWEVEVAI
jgi:hypothetical protein